MNKTISTMVSVLIGAAMLIGCSPADPVQDDLIDYINNQLPTLTEPENTVITEYAAVTGENYVDDATLAARLQEVVIPAAEDLLAKSTAIAPATAEVSAVHSKYIAATTEQLEAFKLLLEAVQTGNAATVDTVNEKLAHADTVSNEFLADLETLKTDHNVVDAEE